jgi:hypothetical protein
MMTGPPSVVPTGSGTTMKNRQGIILGIIAGLLVLTGVFHHYHQKPKKGSPAFFYGKGVL